VTEKQKIQKHLRKPSKNVIQKAVEELSFQKESF
jgi:hypothetical protein